MEIIHQLLSYVIHIDHHLSAIIERFGVLSYLLVFLIIFAETGLVVTPFLPGDSLLFAAGTFAALGSFRIVELFVLILSAAIAGDSVNYAVGKFFGERLLQGNSRLLKKEHIDRTHAYFEKYGGKTIVLARFVPIVRTFAPFIAGMGKMRYGYFFFYNVMGAVLWVGLFVLGGFFFGNVPIIKNNFSVAILIIIFLSILPVVFEFYKHRGKSS